MRNYVRQLDRQVVQRISTRLNNNERNFEDDLFEYSSLRMNNSSSTSAPSTSAGPSTSFPKISMQPPPIINIDDESDIEEGEIVERDVDLVQESFAALNRSRKIQDLTPTKTNLFYEDKSMDDGFAASSIPIYHVIGSPSPVKPIEITESEEIICLNSTQSSQSVDDSVIFVSEERGVEPLKKPTALLSPAINQLMKMSYADTPGTEKKPLTPYQQRKLERTKKYRQKKAQERKSQIELPTETTKKRIILIDGSNVAVSHAKAMQGKNFDFESKNAFSVEGKFNLRHLKID